MSVVNRIGLLRNDNDPNLTYEGDNNVLLQQTANYLLGWFAEKKSGTYILSASLSVCLSVCLSTSPSISLTGGVIKSPLGSVDILNDYQQVLKRKFTIPPGATFLTCQGSPGSSMYGIYC